MYKYIIRGSSVFGDAVERAVYSEMKYTKEQFESILSKFPSTANGTNEVEPWYALYNYLLNSGFTDEVLLDQPINILVDDYLDDYLDQKYGNGNHRE